MPRAFRFRIQMSNNHSLLGSTSRHCYAIKCPEGLRLHMESFEIIEAGPPNTGFDRWVETLKRAGVEAKQIAIAEYDRKHAYNPVPHPRGNEVYVLVPAERLEEALKILKASEGSTRG